MRKKSEFGKGLVICLVKFAEHMERLNIKPSEAEIEIYGSKEKAINSKIPLWFNGASDHLYEIEVPKGKDWYRIRKKVKELQDFGLELGHGWKYMDGNLTLNDVIKARDMARGIALMIDRKIGLKPDIGEW